MNIKQSVINTFNRVGIAHEILLSRTDRITMNNQFGFGSCETSALIAACIAWVYKTSRDFEYGIHKVNISDFDRVRYFVLAEDRTAYMTCLD